MNIILQTLCCVIKENRILLGFKKKGFGQGNWNGFGGKVKNIEHIEQAAKRELFEENGLTAKKLLLVGILEFKFIDKPDEIIKVHIFKCTHFAGELIESDEMKSQWFPLADIPYDKMWGDDKYWLPLLLTGKKFEGKFLFDKNNKIKGKNLQVVANISL